MLRSSRYEGKSTQGEAAHLMVLQGCSGAVAQGRARRTAVPAEEAACLAAFNPLLRTLRRIPREGASAGLSSLGT